MIYNRKDENHKFLLNEYLKFDYVKSAEIYFITDFIDFEKLNLKPKTRFNTSKTLEKLAVSEINNESTYKTDELVIELLNELIASDEETALNFILNHPSFKKYVKKEQD